MFKHLSEDIVRSKELSKLVEEHGFDKELSQLAIGIIDLKDSVPKIFGVNLDSFMYPASVYKIFIGAETLRQIETGTLSMEKEIIVQSPNDVDKDARLFPDTRPLLKTGDRVNIDYLLNLMLTRSDNTASNCLIDLVERENISKNIINTYGWDGSEVTRKFLDRVKEEKSYRYTESTKSCVRHIAEFFYLVETEQLVSPLVSVKLKEYMLAWNRGMNNGFSIIDYLTHYRKGGPKFSFELERLLVC